MLVWGISLVDVRIWNKFFKEEALLEEFILYGDVAELQKAVEAIEEPFPSKTVKEEGRNIWVGFLILLCVLAVIGVGMVAKGTGNG